MVLIVKNQLNGQEKQYVISNWEDFKPLIIDYKGLERRLESARSFEQAKEIILRFFDASTYITAKIVKPKSVAEAGKPLAKSNPLLYAEEFHAWLMMRQKESRQETKPTGADEATKPEEPKPTFMQKIRRMFGV